MIDNGNKCMGCGGCEIVCPAGAIKIKMSEDGFLRPCVNASKCVNCNQCDRICPVNIINTKVSTEAYSYKSKGKETLKKSASGGFGYDLSVKLIESMPVCSVEYDREQARPIHRVSELLEDLDKKRNSIYLQSYTVPGFERILDLGRGIIFGSPCQISFLNNYLLKKKARDHYLLIDFFCHGIPSYNVWVKYMGSKSFFLEMPDVIFRSKEYGWGNFTILCSTGEQNYYFDKVKDHDIFFRMFLENMVLNESCYQCPYHGNNSGADLRIGDYWGEKHKEDTEGVTAILVYTQKGKETIKLLKDKGVVCSESVKEVLAGQIDGNLPVPSIREKLLSALQTSKSLQYINSTTVLKYKLTRKINRMIGRNYI